MKSGNPEQAPLCSETSVLIPNVTKRKRGDGSPCYGLLLPCPRAGTQNPLKNVLEKQHRKKHPQTPTWAPKGSEREPKWSQKGGPGPSGDDLDADSGKKRKKVGKSSIFCPPKPSKTMVSLESSIDFHFSSKSPKSHQNRPNNVSFWYHFGSKCTKKH